MILFFHSILSAGQEYLTVRVPQTDAAYNREKMMERLRLAAFLVGTLALLYGFVRPGIFPALWVAIGAVLLVAAVTLHVIVYRQAIRVTLDASRRWVTLSRVHPNFVQAVNAAEALGRLGARR